MMFLLLIKSLRKKENIAKHGADINSHLAIGIVEELHLGEIRRMGEGRSYMLDISILAAVDKLVMKKMNTSVLSTLLDPHPPAYCSHFAKGETRALAKLTYRQHFPEVIGSALIFI